MRRTAPVLCILFLIGQTFARATQETPDKKPELGSKTLLLVARSGLGDPFFRDSVVLMFPASVKKEEGLIAGVIINKPTRVALSDIFPDDKEFKDRSETAYFGGPVEPRVPLAVFRANKPAKEAMLLFGDVYVSFDPDFIRELLKRPEKPADVRLFLGRAQWGPLQLENEMSIGAWYGVPAEASLIFDSKPDYLWHKLHEQAAPGPMAQVGASQPERARLGQVFAAEIGGGLIGQVAVIHVQ